MCMVGCSLPDCDGFTEYFLAFVAENYFWLSSSTEQPFVIESEYKGRKKDQGRAVQSIVSLMSSLRGQLVERFKTL